MTSHPVWNKEAGDLWRGLAAGKNAEGMHVASYRLEARPTWTGASSAQRSSAQCAAWVACQPPAAAGMALACGHVRGGLPRGFDGGLRLGHEACTAAQPARAGDPNGRAQLCPRLVCSRCIHGAAASQARSGRRSSVSTGPAAFTQAGARVRGPDQALRVLHAAGTLSQASYEASVQRFVAGMPQHVRDAALGWARRPAPPPPPQAKPLPYSLQGARQMQAPPQYHVRAPLLPPPVSADTTCMATACAPGRCRPHARWPARTTVPGCPSLQTPPCTTATCAPGGCHLPDGHAVVVQCGGCRDGQRGPRARAGQRA